MTKTVFCSNIYSKGFNTEREGLKMDKRTLNSFKSLLQQKKDLILDEVTKTMGKGLKVAKEDMPDVMDRSTIETDRNFLLRLRDRERKLLKKINEALKRIENGSFGICLMCGDEINEEQEKKEKLFG